jgi:hypothetical protein
MRTSRHTRRRMKRHLFGAVFLILNPERSFSKQRKAAEGRMVFLVWFHSVFTRIWKMRGIRRGMTNSGGMVTHLI